MASRVRVGASACLVASGLFMAGAGGAIAIAEPEPGHVKSDDRRANDSLGDVIHRALGMDDGTDQKASEPPNRPHTRLGNGRQEQQVPGDPGGKETPPPTPTKETTTTKPSPCPEPGPGQPPGQPTPGTPGGGGGGAIVQLPHFKPPNVPETQLPDELTPGEPGEPGGPAVLDAGAPVAAPGLVGAAAPIALPVIVAPPIGLGGGAGGAGSPGTPPGVPRAVTAESLAGRVPPPANVGSNAAPASPYRIGYNEYLRTAALPQVAVLALPGIAGILVLTGAGGLVGYRQAKAGHVVRVGGTARFMR